MNKFKFATVDYDWTDSDGVYHESSVIFSDAPTPMEHINAVELYDHDCPHDFTLIEVHGFSDVFEAMRYCDERNLIPL